MVAIDTVAELARHRRVAQNVAMAADFAARGKCDAECESSSRKK